MLLGESYVKEGATTGPSSSAVENHQVAIVSDGRNLTGRAGTRANQVREGEKTSEKKHIEQALEDMHAEATKEQ